MYFTSNYVEKIIKFVAFKSILSIIYSLVYGVRDTQGIPNLSDYPFFWRLPLASLALRASKYLM